MLNLKEIMKTPLTDNDLEKYFGIGIKEEILKYSDLKDYNDMNDLLPNDKSFKIILIEYEKNKGHWIAILRYNNKIEIFNSFGHKHNEDDFVESDTMNYYLGQSHIFLNKLIEDEIKDGEFKIIYNKVKFQEEDENINTCGRHVVNRILCMLHYNMTLKDYIDFMKTSHKKTKLNYDQIVSIIIN